MAMKMKLRELRGAEVRYISLVDRAATRIPFRVLKRDKENKMGIDLTGVFKSEVTGKPYVSALVVFAQKDDAAGTQVQEAIKAQGFITDRVQKSDEGETLVYAQQETKGETQVVRLSDQTLVTVSGLKVPNGWMGEVIEEQGFFPDLKMANSALHDQLVLVAKMEAPQDTAQAVMSSYAAYLDQMLILPSACFKLDEAITEIAKKCACQDTVVKAAKKKKPVEGSAEEEAAESSEQEAAEPDAKKAEKKTTKNETEAERLQRIKDHPPAEMAPADEDDDQKGPPEAYKTEILAALKGIEERTTTQLTNLATKLEAVITEQTEHKKVLDGVVQKADTLNTTLRATVTASPVSEDRPTGATMRVQKQDDDPRVGNFDTAMLRRQRR